MRINRAKIVLFFLLTLHPFKMCFSQDSIRSLTDSTSLINFLSNHEEIPGLAFRLVFSTPEQLVTLGADSIIDLTNDGLAISRRFDRLAQVSSWKGNFASHDSIQSKLQFSLFEQPVTWKNVLKFTNSGLANGEISNSTTLSKNSSDLISMAHQAPFLSTKKKGFGYFSDIKIFLITAIIILFISVTVGMIIYMIIFKSNKNKTERLRVEYDEKIVGPLSEILFDRSRQELNSLSSEELYGYFSSDLLAKPLFKEVLIERILSLNKTMKGDFKLKLKELYKRLEFDKLSIRSLSSFQWDKVVSGLVQINEMDLEEAESDVKKLVNSSNFYIRSQAVATLLNISKSVDLSFLSDQNFPLSRWQQMNYLRIIRYLQSHKELKVESLFSSANQSIRLFGYKLVRILGRVDLVQLMVDRFDEVPELERIEMLYTFEILGVPVDSRLINSSLLTSNDKLIRRAAMAAGQIGDETTEKMMWKILPTITSFQLKKSILRSLKTLNPISYEAFIETNTLLDIKEINSHLLDPLLQDV